MQTHYYFDVVCLRCCEKSAARLTCASEIITWPRRKLRKLSSTKTLNALRRGLCLLACFSCLLFPPLFLAAASPVFSASGIGIAHGFGQRFCGTVMQPSACSCTRTPRSSRSRQDCLDGRRLQSRLLPPLLLQLGDSTAEPPSERTSSRASQRAVSEALASVQRARAPQEQQVAGNGLLHMRSGERSSRRADCKRNGFFLRCALSPLRQPSDLSETKQTQATATSLFR